MNGLLRAILVFCGGLLLAALLFFGMFKFPLVAILGDRLVRLPEVQMERLARVLRESPITRAKVLVMGDSTGEFSLDAAGLRDAYSLALVNSTSIEAFSLLEKVVHSGAHPRCLLASFSFSWELNRDYFWAMFVANHFYSEAELEEIFSRSQALGEAPGKWGRFFFGLRRYLAEHRFDDSFSLHRIQEAFASWGWAGSRANGTRLLLEEHKGSSPLRNAAAFDGRLDLVFSGDPALTRTEGEYFRRFLALAEEHQIRVLLLEMPFAASVSDALAEGYWKKFEALLDSVRPGANWNFVRPPRMPDPFYISAGHLTREGGKKMEPFVQAALDGAGCL